MQTAIKEAPSLQMLLGMPAAPPELVVVDERATKRGIQRAYDVAVDLDRRFDLVFTGKGKHVDTMPSVEVANRVRVGDGSKAALVKNIMIRAVCVASPASVALMSAFGAVAASDLAIILAGVIPLTWVPTAAIRSFRADRAAAVDIAIAKPLRATEDDIANLEQFVATVTNGASPLTRAFARQIDTTWIEKGTDDNVLTLTGVNRLAALLDGIPVPSPEIAASAKHLFEARAAVDAVHARSRPRKADVAALEAAVAKISVLEREALAACWRTLLTRNPHGDGRLLTAAKELLPAATTSDTKIEAPIAVVFARPKAAE